jgi:hypothetical protein
MPVVMSGFPVGKEMRASPLFAHSNAHSFMISDVQFTPMPLNRSGESFSFPDWIRVM